MQLLNVPLASNGEDRPAIEPCVITITHPVPENIEHSELETICNTAAKEIAKTLQAKLPYGIYRRLAKALEEQEYEDINNSPST